MTLVEDHGDLAICYEAVETYPTQTAFLKVGYGPLIDPAIDIFDPSNPESYVIRKTKEPSVILNPYQVLLLKDDAGADLGVAYLAVRLQPDDQMEAGIRFKRRLHSGGKEDRVLWA